MSLFGLATSAQVKALAQQVTDFATSTAQRFIAMEASLAGLQTAADANLKATQDAQAAAAASAAATNALVADVQKAVTALQNIPGSPPPIAQSAIDAIANQLNTATAAAQAATAALGTATTAESAADASLQAAETPPAPGAS